MLTDGLAAAAIQFAPLDIFYQLFIFLVLMWLLKKVAWGPLMKVMKDREEYVAGEIEAAEKARKEANELLDQQKELLKASREESQQFIEQARKHGEAQRDEIIRLAHAEAERLKNSAKREIEQEKERAVAALRDQVASLSVFIASKVIEKELSEKDQEAFIQEILEKAGEEQ